MASPTSQPILSSAPKVAFQEPPPYPGRNRRLSAVSTSSTDNSGSSQAHEVFEQDWSTTTAEKDTWATRERRRSSIFNGHTETYPSIAQRNPGSPTDPTYPAVLPGERRGSILSLWLPGKDKEGKSVLHSDDHGDWVDEIREVQKQKEAEEPKEELPKKGSSILSMWKKGKDENGNSIILSGDLEEDEKLRLQKEEAAARAKAMKIAKLKKQMEALQTELDAEEQEHVRSRDVAVSG